VSTPDPQDPYAAPPDTPQPPRQRRPRPKVKAPDDHPAARAGRLAMLVGIAGVGMTILLFPVGLMLDAVAVLLGTRARKRGREAGVRAPGALAAIILGASSGAVALAVLAVLGPQLVTYSECLSGANTEIAKQNCRDALFEQLEQRFGIRLPQSVA